MAEKSRPGAEILGPPLSCALPGRHSLGGSAQTQGVPESATVAAGRDRLA